MYMIESSVLVGSLFAPMFGIDNAARHVDRSIDRLDLASLDCAGGLWRWLGKQDRTSSLASICELLPTFFQCDGLQEKECKLSLVPTSGKCSLPCQDVGLKDDEHVFR